MINSFNFKRYATKIISVLSLLSVIVGFAGCRQVLIAESTPGPISKSNIPRQFNIVGFTDSNKPVLFEHEVGLQDTLEHYDSKAEFQKSHNDRAVLWSEDCKHNKKYSFYINPDKREDIERSLSYSHDYYYQSVKIKILENHPKTRKQKVYINFGIDDFSYYSIYSVDNRSVTPIEYGDLIKADGVVAFVEGFKYMILFYAIGRIALAVAIRYQSGKQQET